MTFPKMTDAHVKPKHAIGPSRPVVELHHGDDYAELTLPSGATLVMKYPTQESVDEIRSILANGAAVETV